MKKLLAVLLMLALLAACAGCAQTPPVASESESAPAAESTPATSGSESVPDLAAPDETALRETLRPYLDAYNLVLAETFGAETEETAYTRYYESEEAAMASELRDIKAMAPAADPAPEGLTVDPSYAECFPVTNYAALTDIYAAFGEWLDVTAGFFTTAVTSNFFEYDGRLYLERGGRGYGASHIDPDSAVLAEAVAVSAPEGDRTDYTVRVDNYLFDEKDGAVTLTLSPLGGRLLVTEAVWAE